MKDVPVYDASQRMVDPNRLGDSSVLTSSSTYLNSPRLRDGVATESLRRKTHDIGHVITGFRYDPVGEFGLIVLKGMNLTRFMGMELIKHLNAYSQFLLTTGISRISLHYPEFLPAIYKVVGLAGKMGREMKSIFTPRYEEIFEWRVDSVREELPIIIPVDKEDAMWSIKTYYD